MSTILTGAIIDGAKAQVDNYITTTKGLYTQLSNTVTKLVTQDFTGDASNGYRQFYEQKVVPAITTNLTDGEKSLMVMINDLLEDIKKQLLYTLDPDMGENNRNAGSTAEQDGMTNT